MILQPFSGDGALAVVVLARTSISTTATTDRPGRRRSCCWSAPAACWPGWCRCAPRSPSPRRPAGRAGGDPSAGRRRRRAGRGGAGGRLDLHHRGGRPAEPVVKLQPVGADGVLAGLVLAPATSCTTTGTDQPGRW
ncbi:hypothetical protein FZ983_33520 [Azospirillum sp. B21]|uniref:hypothetical protein n=1 Tax=Azospirillum sp. B21 TaxID=2607496 RepID=UPI0011EEF48A|nr:hypothetical protein [Azospirillum sp. B21]KAA0571310.1 hypothetical protein FZ983_33520 [Azospirillum sp. B21]